MILWYYISILHHYWPFPNHGFCFNLASYQWSWIIEDCSRHRISVRVFSMFEKKTMVFLGPGSLGPGPMVPLGPSLGDGESYLQSGKATYCQASYLLSGKLPTVRQSYLLSGKLPTVRHAPNRFIDMYPKGIDMHPQVSIDLHPTTAYFAPNNRIHAPKRLHILCTQIPHTCTQTFLHTCI